MVRDVPWRLAKSLSSKKERERTHLTVAEGPPSVLSALEARVSVEFVAISRSYRDSPAFSAMEEALKAGYRGAVHVVPDSTFDRMSDTRTPQGAMCVLPWPFTHLEGPPKPAWDSPLHLLAIDIQDPGNAGTLIRAAAAAGVTGAEFAGDSTDIYSPKCIRASAGAAFRVALAQRAPEVDPREIVAGFIQRGIEVYKAVPRGGEAPWALDLAAACSVVAGNEARGLRTEIVEGPGRRLSIPMAGGIESLNVALATGMILYEAHRQRFSLMGPSRMV